LGPEPTQPTEGTSRAAMITKAISDAIERFIFE
jgi:hypothetical protein